MLFSLPAQESIPVGALFCLAGSAVFVAVFIVTFSIRIVPEGKRLDIYRLGRYVGRKGPGIIVVIPLIDRVESVDSEGKPPEVSA